VSTAWTTAGASMPGARHLSRGAPNQDAFACEHGVAAGRELVLLAVADGAGSAPRSAEGAAIAVGAATAAARARVRTHGVPDDGPGWRALLDAVADELLDRFGAAAGALAPGNAQQFACTLTLAVIADPWVGVLSAGDSFSVIRRRDGSLHLPHAPVHVADDPTRVELIDGPDARSAVVTRVIEDADVTAVALASDGLDRAALRREAGECEPHQPFLGPLLSGVPGSGGSRGLAEFLLADPALADTTDDDRTLVLAVRA
jgi:hypothetical protein